jgi:exopolyphosphatase / guanosine-5'-triphosphate,3'-diphosphate pyrophosphatase
MPFRSNLMRLAAIDLGTNSFHMIIVDVSGDMTFRTVDRVKEMIRIGDGSITTKQITAAAMEQGIETLLRFKRFAELRGVEVRHIFAFATSAIREAKNGGTFTEMVSNHVGIRTEVISGLEEARLIYLAIRKAIDLGKKNALMIDAGGGSVELMVGNSDTLILAESFKLGVARMQEQFIKSDIITETERRALHKHIHDALNGFAKKASKLTYSRAIASSGTAENIAAMIHFAGGANRDQESLNGVTFTRKQFSKLHERLLKLKPAERKAIYGLDPKRADLIIPGMILFDAFMDMFSVNEITISSFALREGMVIDYLSKHLTEFRIAERYAEPRRQSVIELATRCYWDEARSVHIAKLSVRLFEQLAPLHKLGKAEKELLEYAALLHNIGYFISPSGHHKHSQYLIQNGELRGFTPEDITIMGHVARYHRKSPPKPEHLTFFALSQKQQFIVRVLAGILRVANALDRTHRQNVKDIKAKLTEKEIALHLLIELDAEFELWAVERVKEMLEEALSRRLTLHVKTL